MGKRLLKHTVITVRSELHENRLIEKMFTLHGVLSKKIFYDVFVRVCIH